MVVDVMTHHNKRIVRECPMCHNQPTMLKRYSDADDWIGYSFLCCSLSSGEFKPLRRALSAWADAVKEYVADHPEAYND